jgi:hypothetical protein
LGIKRGDYFFVERGEHFNEGRVIQIGRKPEPRKGEVDKKARKNYRRYRKEAVFVHFSLS